MLKKTNKQEKTNNNTHNMFLGDVHDSSPGNFVEQLGLGDKYFVFGGHQAGETVVAFLLWKKKAGKPIGRQIILVAVDLIVCR